MIEEPPKLTIKRPSRRPSAEQIRAFDNIPSGYVVDAMDGTGALDLTVQALGEGRDIPSVASGPALTADTGAGDILALLGALKFIQAGDIVVSAFGGYQGCAACGDRLAGMISNNGAIGLVTDGPIRDYTGMVELGLPTWCTGISPNSPVAQGPGTIGLPIQIAGRQVETGDMIVADRDGVVVVPFAQIPTVVERLQRIQELETQFDNDVANGQKIPPAIEEMLSTDQVRYLD